MRVKQNKQVARKPRRDAEIILIGHQMSNVLHNLGQQKARAYTEHEQQIFRDLQRKWDAAMGEYRGSFKRKK